MLICLLEKSLEHLSFFFCKFCKQHFLVQKIGINVELFQKNVKDEKEFFTFLLLLDSVINKYSSF